MPTYVTCPYCGEETDDALARCQNCGKMWEQGTGAANSHVPDRRSSQTGPVEYDPKIIRQFATRLYAQARAQFAIWTVLGVLAGLIAGGAWLQADSERFYAGVLLFLLLGGVGWAIGSARAFSLKLQAQSALCQVQIEENTRSK